MSTLNGHPLKRPITYMYIYIGLLLASIDHLIVIVVYSKWLLKINNCETFHGIYKHNVGRHSMNPLLYGANL